MVFLKMPNPRPALFPQGWGQNQRVNHSSRPQVMQVHTQGPSQDTLLVLPSSTLLHCLPQAPFYTQQSHLSYGMSQRIKSQGLERQLAAEVATDTGCPPRQAGPAATSRHCPFSWTRLLPVLAIAFLQMWLLRSPARLLTNPYSTTLGPQEPIYRLSWESCRKPRGL